MTRIAVLSDIHGNLQALQAVLKDIRRQGFDRVFCAGDLVGYGPWPDEVAALLQERQIPSVMGNYDEAVGFLLPACGCHIGDPEQKRLSDHSLKWTIEHTSPATREYLRGLPEQISESVEGHNMLLTHAGVDSINEYVYEEDRERIGEILGGIEEDIYIYGHTHFPFVRQAGGKTIINAGSVGRPKQGDNRASYIDMRITSGRVEADIIKVAYDVERAAADVVARGLDPGFARFLLYGGDSSRISCALCGRLPQNRG